MKQKIIGVSRFWLLFLAALGLNCGSAKEKKPDASAEPGPAANGSIESFADADGAYRLVGTYYSNGQAQFFADLNLRISDTLASAESALPFISAEVCPVNRWLVAHGSAFGARFRAALCLGDDGKMSWQCGVGTFCLPVPLPAGFLTRGNGQLAKKGICRGPPNSLQTTQEGYLAALCQDKTECLPQENSDPALYECFNPAPTPWRIVLTVCFLKAGAETCYPVILEKSNPSP